MHKKAKLVANLMGLLANENRLLILYALLEGSKTVKELSEFVPDISAPALSQHLHKLRHTNLIWSKKKSHYIYYSIADERIRNLINLLQRDYCS